jgi:hypothetical protein
MQPSASSFASDTTSPMPLLTLSPLPLTEPAPELLPEPIIPLTPVAPALVTSPDPAALAVPELAPVPLTLPESRRLVREPQAATAPAARTTCIQRRRLSTKGASMGFVSYPNESAIS